MSQLYVIRFLFSLVFVVGFSVHSVAQNTSLILNAGDQLFENKDYFGAVEVYKKAISVDSNQAKILYKYGKSLAAINNNKLASKYLKKALAYDQRKEFVELPFELAEAYRSAGNYKQAKRYYNRAIRPYRTDREGYWYKKISNSKKANEWAYKNASGGFSPLKNLGNSVNTDFAEFGASISNGKLYYAAMVADSVGLGNVINDRHFYSRIYYKSLNDQRKGKLLEFDRKFNDFIGNQHVSNPFVFQDELYFTICDTNFNCEIWKGKLSSSKVSELKKLNRNINTTASNNTQPHVIEEEGTTYLYFVSDRNQGFGGLDIWKSKLESFGFGQAINLGSAINSMDNEITPYYDTKSRTLFFSSNWHIGFGGYDVFKSRLERRVFQPAENLGTEINSNYHEYYFRPYQQLAIISSNRVDGNVENANSCCNDLYETSFLREDALDEPEIVIVDEASLNQFLPLSLYFHNDSPNPRSTDTTTTENFSTLSQKYFQLKASYLQSYIPTLPEDQRAESEIKLSNFFDIEVKDGTTELEKITPLLLEELEKGHKLTLSVRGFASSISNSEYNLNLTLRRIQSLINYLKSEGFSPYIESGYLKFNKIPFGDLAVSSNIDDEDNISAVYSLEAAKERRIEIIAIQSNNPDSVVKLQKLPELKIVRKEYSAIATKGSTVKRTFVVENRGRGNLEIYQVVSNLEDVMLVYPKTISANGKGQIEIEVLTEQLDQSSTIELLMVTNDPEHNLETIRLDIRLTN